MCSSNIMNPEDASPSGEAKSNRCQGSGKTITRIILSQDPANKTFARRAQHDWSPYIRQGGLFIPTQKQYQLGDEVFLLLNLMDEPEKIPVAGKVIWITPKGAQGNRAAGIGVQFNGDDETARTKIESYLAGSLSSDRPTHTM